MLMANKPFCVLLAILFHVLAACAPQPPRAPDAAQAVPAVTDNPKPTVASTRSFQDVTVPLPQGQWHEVGEVTDTSVENFPQHHAIYASISGGVIDRVITVWWQRRERPEDWFTPYAYCDHQSYLYAVVITNSRNNHACWHVRAVNLGLAGDAPNQNRLIAEFAAHRNLYSPVTMVGVRFVEGRGFTRHYIEYLWNVDLLLPRKDGSVWRPADWHADAITGDPRRQTVAQALADWGARWRTVVMTR